MSRQPDVGGMARKYESPGAALLSAWRRLASVPGGAWVFSRYVGFRAPYTGTIRARITTLEPGYARAELRDRRRNRNHLASVHAIALANLGELVTGLAVSSSLALTSRGIPTEIVIEYAKKARGTLTAECRTQVPDVSEPMDHWASAEIRDPDGDVVARLRARWRLAPR